MSVIDVWMKWLGVFGIVPFLIAMTVFLGGYVMVRPKLSQGTSGQRRALAMVCLVGGLLVGGMMGAFIPDMDTKNVETGDVDSSVHPASGIFTRIMSSFFVAVFVFVVLSNVLKKRLINDRNASIAVGLISGLLFFLAGPAMSFLAVVVFGILLWIIHRFIRLSYEMSIPH
ncbi:MAG: hypothetical protein HOC71_02880 [Candidatus Latescibacteria bacterium]|jgi:ABC-type uncharacterized transport system permease subunit|nr:hypothetical protein [Candidatus Latescibacterota bacterium]